MPLKLKKLIKKIKSSERPNCMIRNKMSRNKIFIVLLQLKSHFNVVPRTMFPSLAVAAACLDKNMPCEMAVLEISADSSEAQLVTSLKLSLAI